MFHVEQIRDDVLIKKVIFDDAVKHTLFTSLSQEEIDKEVGKLDRIFLGLFDGDEIVGILIFRLLEEVGTQETVYMCDVAFLQKARGKSAYLLGREGLRQFFKKTKCDRLVGKINIENKPSLYMALHTGFKILKKINDYYILGVEKNGYIVRRR